ncbi:putative uncharacterized protein DDB_G0274435 isoform X2 [Ctenocephalides felis]|uniref:putative uncharacterized protein DDB_G0274435 isoform X2 n=1 Tax=Ctenocephalides felis TaxID=7515 RepID=UPI000E6E1F66|nr:putative uncharacterized protein DDB_G0274435 isoform X2 [Ctenocephalides felis]
MNAATELQALMLKAGSPVMLDRDSGFCSDEEIDMHVGTGAPSPPTDASEDSSVDVKVVPISVRNKRKCAEPSRVVNSQSAASSHHPIKKRPRFTNLEDEESSETFRPWNSSSQNPAQVYNRHPGVTTLHRAFAKNETAQDEPLSLVAKSPAASANTFNQAIPVKSSAKTDPRFCDQRLQCSGANQTSQKHQQQQQLQQHHHHQQQEQQQQQQRNYKNMTRERRIEANARERTRVHTISAAFDTLRKAIPAYSHNQKLSKLSVLRIACSYIMTLSRISGTTLDSTENSLADCVDLVSRTIQTEGKLRKKKED